jgi:PKD repeat protein
MPSRHVRTTLVALVTGLVVGGSAATASPAEAVTPPGGIGHQDQSYAPLSGSITGTKPESKLWYDHAAWWAVMGHGSQLSIWRLDRGTDSWTDTGTIVEARTLGDYRADALAEGDGSVTIATHLFINAGHGVSPPLPNPSTGARLTRYDFDASTDMYVPVPGFVPAAINDLRTETLVVDRDSTGALWATWTYGLQAWFSHTTAGDDAVWSQPQVVPETGTLDSDDVSSIVRFGGSRIGIMVSNQFENWKLFFAVHQDGASDLLWSTETVPIGVKSDDHINLKADGDGRVFAAVKTSENVGSQPLVLLAVRSETGTWTTDRFGTVSNSHTRPIVLLDESHDLVHMYATDSQTGGDIVEKTTSMDNPDFAAGVGTVVIHDPSGYDLNDATSTKQNVDPSTGIVVLADNDATKTYWHLDETLGAVPLTARFTTSATTGAAPLGVTFTDTSLGGPQAREWSFGDGSSSTARAATHVYASRGTYVVRLTVSSGGTTSWKEATVTVTGPPPVDQGGGTPTTTTPAPPATPPTVEPPSVPGVTQPGPSVPGTSAITPSQSKAPKLRGVIQLTGRRVGTVISCSRSGTATLSHRGVKLASARFTCKSGRATVRFSLGPKGARRLKATTRPAVVVTLRIGTTSTKLRRNLARGTD